MRTHTFKPMPEYAVGSPAAKVYADKCWFQTSPETGGAVFDPDYCRKPREAVCHAPDPATKEGR